MKKQIDLAKVYPAYPLPRLSRERLRKVRPSQWQAGGLRKPKEGKWRSYWVTVEDLIAWSGGLPHLLAKYRTVDAVLECLWRTYDREVPHIYGYFVEVRERDRETYREHCEKFFSSEEVQHGS